MSAALCPCHPSGRHYFIFMPVPGWFCIDCGLLRNAQAQEQVA